MKHRKHLKMRKQFQNIRKANQSGLIHSHWLPKPNPDAVRLIVAMDACHEWTNL